MGYVKNLLIDIDNALSHRIELSYMTYITCVDCNNIKQFYHEFDCSSYLCEDCINNHICDSDYSDYDSE